MKRFSIALVFFCGTLSLFVSTPALSDRVSGLTQALSNLPQADLFTVIKNLKVAPVPKTGQTTSYETGDDGDVQEGVSWPNPRFTDNGNATVTDNLTGLVWMKHANDIDADGFPPQSWEDACKACKELKNGEHSLTDGSVAGDWHLPNLRELQSLVDYGKAYPALPPGHPFPGVLSHYFWSSTHLPTDEDIANALHFGDGYLGGQFMSNLYYVWCVRSLK